MDIPETGSAVQSPYVGLRPFERDEAYLFFGRERDEQLIDHIVAARLTLLYAQSGLGKTSLLRTLVIPQLEQEHYRPFYFDAWSGDDPAGALKVALARQIMQEDAAEQWRERPLIELVREVAQATGRSPVLLLDQFEEFLITHSQQLDPVRQELAAVVRASGVDAHIVLIMREEFLATLEPFRQVILDLFQSTFRLENLTADGVRAAISCPAQALGVTVEPQLIERLMTDLQSKRQTSKQEPVRPAIDLPMLQLVLSQLWSLTAGRGSPDLSLTAYESLGGADRILDGYVKTVMPKRPHDRLFTARLLQLLAPPSGYKASYTIDDLAELTGLDRGSIDAELNRLGQHRIIRSRDFQGSRRYELLHDAFIPVITPWRNRELHDARHRRIWLRSGMAAAVVLFTVAAGLAGYAGYRNSEIYKHTEGALAAATSDIKSTFEQAIFYQLRYAQGWFADAPLDGLRSMLVKHQDKIDPSQWIYTEGLGQLRSPPDDWPFVLEYGSGRKFDEWQFRLHWRDMASSLASNWGIPSPTRLRLKASPELPENGIVLTGPNGRQARFEIPVIAPDALISKSTIAEQAREFLQHFSREWIPVKEVTTAEYLGVPLWSLPAWNVLGVKPFDREAATALLLANDVLKQPQVFLGKPTVDRLVERVGVIYPSTIAEARAARGDRLGDDIVALIQHDNRVTGRELPRIFDLLAELPHADVEDAAKLVAEQGFIDAIFLTSFQGPPPPPTKDGNPPAEGSTETTESQPPVSSSETADNYLDLTVVEPLIRAYLGKDVEKYFWSGRLDPELLEGIESARDRLYRATGVSLPGVSFRGTNHDDADVEPSQMRIEIVNQNVATTDAKAFGVDTQKSAIGSFMDRLIFRAQKYLPLWVGAEQADDLKWPLQPHMRAWIESRYSLTDLKVLFRKMVMWSATDFEKIVQSPPGTWVDLPPQNSIRDADWMLGSLVFWNEQQINLRDPDQVTEILRVTQQAARKEASGKREQTTDAEGEISGWIDQGIAALDADAIDAASAAFRAATALDAPAAREAFLAAYPKLLSERTSRACGDLLEMADAELLTLVKPDFSREQQLDIEEAIDVAPSDERRRLQICLLAATDRETRPHRWNHLVSQLEADSKEIALWRGDEAGRLGAVLVENYNPLTADRDLAEKARPLFDQALDWLSVDKARALYSVLLTTCQKPGPRRWCWTLAGDLAKSHSRDGLIPLDFAWVAQNLEQRNDLQNASILLETADDRVKSSSLTKEDKFFYGRVAEFTRATIENKLAILNLDDHLEPIIQKFKELGSSEEYLAEDSQIAFIELLTHVGRYDEARAELEAARQRWPDKVHWSERQFWLAMASDDTDAARDAADQFSRYLDDHPDDQNDTIYKHVLFQAALSEFLLPRDPWKSLARKFLLTDHEYVHYVAVLLYAFEEGQNRDAAHKLLEANWKAVDPSSWQRRLEVGDPGVWREMLIGYYLGKVSRDQLFSPLADDETFNNSHFANLPLARLAMLCEAHFYDALLMRMRGSPAEMHAALEQAVSTGYRTYVEYSMAKFLLANEGKTLTPPRVDQQTKR